MRHESQVQAIEAMQHAMEFIRSLPEYVEIRTVEFSQAGDTFKVQTARDSFRELFAGKKVYRYCGGTMANGKIGSYQFYASLVSSPEAVSDGDYVIPPLELAKGE